MNPTLKSLLCWFSTFVAAQSLPSSRPIIDLNRFPPQPQENSCGGIIRENLYEHEVIFDADRVVQCLTSVPFVPAVGLRFLAYLNQTFQFYSTTAFLKNPPEEYQQPPFDLFHELQQIKDHVEAGLYHNQYAFEIAVQNVLQRSHDDHLIVYGGISSRFDFFSPYYFTSVSKDGKQVPDIYLYYDLVKSFSSGLYDASPVKEINGEPAVSFLKAFASYQSRGMVEPHADWNQIMTSPAQRLFGINSMSEVAPFYAGNDFSLTLQNGTHLSDRPWQAIYNSPGFTGPLENGGDFYNIFVQGIPPANYESQYIIYRQNQSAYTNDESSPALEDDADQEKGTKPSWHKYTVAYPEDTIISHQADLGLLASAVVTGYFLPDISTAVLSLPSFEMFGDAIGTFKYAIQDFIANATDESRAAKKVVIDLQQNSGGLAGLAQVAFDQFFPGKKPYSGSRMRTHHLADILGEVITDAFDASQRAQPNNSRLKRVVSEWIATKRIDARTGTNFASWKELRGPVSLEGDDFSLIQQRNLPDDRKQDARSPPWEPEDIIILTDGLCGSTCALFVEMMREAGVRSVAIGGIPASGPMQAASGSRGAARYSGGQLDKDFAFANRHRNATSPKLPDVPSNTGMRLVYTGFTLRDQFRKGETRPNQVLYMPADYRLYWSLANFHNYTRLWMDVHDAAFVDSSKCVPGSVNVPTAPHRPSGTVVVPLPLQDLATRGLILRDLADDAQFENLTRLKEWDGDYDPGVQTCDSVPICFLGSCETHKYTCLQGCPDLSCSVPNVLKYCSERCTNANPAACPSDFRCRPDRPLSSKDLSIEHSTKAYTEGHCVPPPSWEQRYSDCSSILDRWGLGSEGF